MITSRRGFLTQAAAAVALASDSTHYLARESKQPGATSEKPEKRPIRVNRIAVSTYSFWQFKNAELRDIEKNIDWAADMGFDGVELLHRQMEKEDNGTLQNIKRRAFRQGLDLHAFPLPHAFLTPPQHHSTQHI